MPPPPCDPTALHQAFAASRPLDWGEKQPTTAEITELHGERATRRSLELLERTVEVEPRVTGDFLNSIPVGTTPYHLENRIKSPESLARKLRDQRRANKRRPVDDLLRYTVLTESPDDLVAATLDTADALATHGWRVDYAMHSYTEGSRYKGLHAWLRTPDIERVEVQWHSRASARVKELTTSWYEVERSATATDSERTAAREKCVAASAELHTPRGLDAMTELGGRQVQVKNYSDSRSTGSGRRVAPVEERQRPAKLQDRAKGIAL
ncbi:hypothetical protein GCM10009630_27380 [Kribbella jejuensis]|uniref:RelA/SpoT family protein n=1 Tax=Kribbella jejuensis TaxID=236068 RepID=A0A542EPR1_9ACTN|nr:RelA/SpoT domain-containing protein [Kribbella jejuensis]TQJ17244.1 RelA/SpoT family protein [Kribbella jejuensis]